MIRWAAFLVWVIGLTAVVIWVAPATEDSFDIGLGSHPSVAMDVDSHVVVVWENSDNEVQAQELSAAGERVGNPLRVDATDAEQHTPVVSHLISNDFAVVWEESGEDGPQIRGQRLRIEDEPASRLVHKGGKFIGAMFRVTASGSNPAIGNDDGGSFTVAWTAPASPAAKARAKGNHLHFVRRFDASNSPISDETALGKRGFATPPAVAVRLDGNSLIVWEDVARNIRGSVIDGSGAVISENFRVNASLWGKQRAPAAAVALDGHFTVVWERRLPSGDRWLYGRRVTASGEFFGDEFQISLSPSDGALEPAVAADSLGRSLATWTSSPPDSGVSEVLGRRLGLGEGSATGSEMSIAPPDARSARIRESTGTDDFVVVWQGTSDSLAAAQGDSTIFGRFLQLND